MGYVEITLNVDGVDVDTTSYGEGEELPAEAYREGIVMLGKMVTNEVEMFVQYHAHDEDMENCICSQYEETHNKWSNHA